jgi:hypothetical protein
MGFNPLGGVGVGVGADILVGVGEAASPVGILDGKAVGDGESIGTAVESFVGAAV